MFEHLMYFIKISTDCKSAESSSWEASESHCAGLGGHLMSINDPDTQQLILVHANDPDAVGKTLMIAYH